MAQIFGFEITKNKSKDQEELPSFVLPDPEDGASTAAAGFYSEFIDILKLRLT
jgi:hypothetical protein